ncbi:hypothetical protein CXF43_06440 [Corynebacterium bovis]|uniref:Uncharacterized protein n=1 Tax=Corynebacterium bovis TaxID=36808 RepID=A0A3R8PLT8_9CORY|nr:hypothetical protein CXF40_02615 [Corynebacterium bovis]RRO95352.1 hypothetical protein CXF32_07675 [Corynebacterium bovis]RRQ00973.1 hypothetical protein CXF41_05120 [Corynebacterium bovis]RRQ05023.1 hypothetical protein CXF42_02875 [Corynebacterium bovis]RRQ06933.1 hypothetical protein CXF43_06440 [Corynebacterium bovis]
MALVTLLAVGACGSDDGGDGAQETSASAPAAGTASSPAPTSSAAPSSSPAPEQTAPAQPGQPGQPADPAGEDGPRNPAPGELPIDETVPVAPVPGAPAGTPAGGTSGEDATAIANLVNGLGVDRPASEYTRYVWQHTCSKDNDASGGADALREQSEAFVGRGQWGDLVGPDVLPRIRAVNDVSVDGDRATAQVSATTNGQDQDQRMTFAREGGQWTFCTP